MYFLWKMSAYRKGFDETKYISFLTKDDELLETCNEILEKAQNSVKKRIWKLISIQWKLSKS